jgi:hypothetical protein
MMTWDARCGKTGETGETGEAGENDGNAKKAEAKAKAEEIPDCRRQAQLPLLPLADKPSARSHEL